MGFAQLAYIDRVMRINQALSAIAWAGGNGVSYTLKDKKGVAVQFIKHVGAANVYNSVPIQTHMLVTNMIFNDFINTRDLIGGHLNQVPFELVSYFALCFDEIVRREIMDVDMSDEHAVWDAALKQQQPDIQSAVRRAIQPYERQRAHMRRQVFMQKVGIKRVIGKMQQITGQSAAAWAAAKSVPTFPNVLAAVEWESRGEYKGVLTSQN
jgi:hypothetical protein